MALDFNCWVLEITDTKVTPGVVPIRGIEQPETFNYHYTFTMDGAVGTAGIATGMLQITSAKPLTLRAGQNILIQVAEVE